MPGLPKLKHEAQPGELLGGYYTQQQLAAQLGKRPSTLKRWARIGYGPPKTLIGRAVYYAKASTAAWLQSREQGIRAPKRT